MQTIDRHRWLWLGAGLLFIGAGVGYGIAKLTSSKNVPAAAATATEAKGNDSLQLPESFLTTMGIALETIAPGSLNAEIQLPGTIVAAPNGQAVVTARTPGAVIRLDKHLGDQVRKGDVLALLDSPEAAAMAAERATAESKLELARSIYKREQGLYEQKVTPRQDLETAQAQLSAAEVDATRARRAVETVGVSKDGRVMITSPIDGRITTTSITLGAHVGADVELFRVADPRFVMAQAAVAAIDAARIHVGETAKVVTATGMELDAKVTSVTPTLDEQTRAATVSLSLLKPTGITPGEFVQVRISSPSDATNSFVLPDESVQNVNGHEVVFVRTATGFKATPVIVGTRTSGRALILSGLKPGDVVATKNAFLLKAEIGKGADEEE